MTIIDGDSITVRADDFSWPKSIVGGPLNFGKQKCVGLEFSDTGVRIALTIGSARELIELIQSAIDQSCAITN